MHSLSKTNPVKIVRKICGLTQERLADVIACNRLTVHTLESGRLKLSVKMAEKISLHTGVSQTWLLGSNHRLPPRCERDPERPYTREVFNMTRAEVLDPRVHPLDVRVILQFVIGAYRQLLDSAWQAYRDDQIVYFYFMVREFLGQLGHRWPDSRKIRQSMTVEEIVADAEALLEECRIEKARSKTSKKAAKALS